MCDPVTIMAIGAGVGAVGSLASADAMQNAAGGYNAQANAYFSMIPSLGYKTEWEAKIAERNSKTYELEAKTLQAVGEYNALAAETEALMILRQSRAQAHDLRKAGSKLMGSQVARYGKANVEMAGTPAEVLAVTAKEVEEDVAYMLENGETSALSTRLQGRAAKLQANSAAAKSQMQAFNLTSQADALRFGLPSQEYALRMQAYGSQMQAYGLEAKSSASKIGAWSNLLTTIGSGFMMFGSNTTSGLADNAKAQLY